MRNLKAGSLRSRNLLPTLTLIGLLVLLSVPAAPSLGAGVSAAAHRERAPTAAVARTSSGCGGDRILYLPCVPGHAGTNPLAAPSGHTPSALTHNSWNQICTACPLGAREDVQMAYDAANGYLLAFGGYANGVVMADTWTYSGGTWTQQFPTSSPPARFDGAMAYDPADGYVVLFGGVPNTACSATLSDTWEYKAGVWTQLSPSSVPSGRFFPSLTWDAADGYLVLFGGTDCAGAYHGGTWEFGGGQWTHLSPVTSPSPRLGAGMAYDAQGKQVILFGGYNGASSLNDTWAFAGGSWSRLTLTTTPAARSLQGQMMVTSSRGEPFFFGGWDFRTSACFGDTWTWTSGKWTQQFPATSPIGRGWSSMANDPGQGILLYGGYDCAADQADTWVYATGPQLTIPNPTPATVEVGQTVQFNSTLVYGGTPPDTFFWTWGPKAWMTCTPSTTLFTNCTALRSGNYTITVWANDSIGELSPATLSPFYVFRGPEVSVPRADRLTADVGQTVNLSTSLTYAGSGGDSYAWTESGAGMGCPSSTAITITCIPTTPGTYNVTAWVYDSAGGSGWNTSTSILVSALPAAGAPAATPLASVDVGQTVTFSADVTNNGSGSDHYAWTISPGGGLLCPVSAGPTITCTSVAAGSYSVTLTVIDSNHGWGAGTLSYQVVALPTLGAPTPSVASVDVGQSMSFSPVVVGGGSGGLSFAWSASNGGFGCGAPALSVYNCTPLVAGNYTVSVSATDSNGGRGSAVGGAFRVYALPEVSAPSSQSTSLAAGEAMTFTSDLLSAGSGGDTYTWSTSNPSFTCATSTGLTAVCTPTKTGSYTVTLTVNDSNTGRSSASSAFLTVTAPLQATASASPTSGDVPLSVTFASSAWGGTAPYTYTWRFGDGAASSSSAPNPSHTYAASGTFTATLWVNDSAGSSVAVQVRLTVSAAPTPAGIDTIPGGITTLGLFLLLAVVVALAMGLLMRRSSKARRELEEVERRQALAPAPVGGTSAEPPM